MELPIKAIGIDELVPAKYNPNEMTPKELSKLTNSIKEYGVVDPIIINLKDNTVIGGHHRIKALKKQKVSEVYVAELGDVGWVFNETNLKIPDKDTEKIMNIALNNISGEMNESKLTQVLSELERNKANYKLTGFDELDLERLKLDHEILIDKNALQTTVDSLQTPTPMSNAPSENEEEINYKVPETEEQERVEDMSEEEMLEEMNEAIVRHEEDMDILETTVCPHCGKEISIEEFVVDTIAEKDGLL